MRISISLIGTSPLLLHNPDLADPDHPITKQIKEITNGKGWNENEELRRKVERFEWFGGLYIVPGIDGPALPVANIRQCLIEAGRITRGDGVKVERALSAYEQHVPLVYEGPRDRDRLFDRPEFQDRRSIGIGSGRAKRRVMRMRPKFPRWAVVADFELDTEILTPERMSEIVSLAGRAVGLGDNRRNAFGRFTGEVKPE